MKQFSLLALAMFGTMLAATAQSKESYLIVGTYTSPGKSEGIYVYKFNTETGEATPVSSAVTNNPSYVAISPNEKYVYAVHEVDSRSGKGGEISAFSFDKKTGKLTLINNEPSGGDHPCYVEVDKTGKWVFAGNYSSGSLSVYPVNKDGSLGAPSTIQHTGTGKDPQRQEKPHVHCTYMSPENKFLFVPDLGADKVMIYAFDARTGKLTPAKQPFVAADPVGGGPRHFVIHPNKKYAYLIEELSGNVVAYQYNKGELKEIQSISTHEDKPGFAGSADIHVSADGKFLYASNRGDFNTIGSFSIDAATGKLTPLEHISTKGKAPRNFNLDPSGNFLLVGNQTSDEIVIFNRDKVTGKLQDSEKRIKVFAPVCIKWISVK